MAFFLRNRAAYTANRNAWSRLPGPWKCQQSAILPRHALILLRPRYSSSSFSPNPLKWSLRRHIITLSALGTVTAALYFLQPIYSLINAPTSAQSLTLFQPSTPLASQIDSNIRAHPLAQALRSNPSFTESRPHLRLPESIRQHSLTAGTLAGPGRLVVPPLAFYDDKGGKLVSLAYLGEDLCGHVGIVHGGMLATLMDESMGRCGLAALPGKIGYTANLKVDYRKPVKAGSYVVVRAEVVRLEGRKVWVRGRIEGLRVGVGGVGGVGGGEVGGKGEEGGEGQGDLLVEAEALFVEPKNAKFLPKLLTVQPP